ncbi:MAG: hypothetical protein M0036_04475 [Desulfobacteraceae bacterium]|nr:hypothetical protein [Desulfobacteraceae bacterium]
MYLKPSIHKPLAVLIAGLFPFFFSSGVACEPSAGGKTATIHADTPQPDRFVVRGERLVDLERPGQAVFFRGMGYSPFLPGESPILFGSPGNDGRYAEHLTLLRRMNVNYLHLFPRLMGSRFFQALDRTDLVYGQDIYIQTYENDYLHPAFLSRSLKIVKEIIDHTYKVGRPDRLVLFSIGDELVVESIIATDTRHRGVRDYTGKHLSVSHRTPTEVALAMLVDQAMDYE